MKNILMMASGMTLALGGIVAPKGANETTEATDIDVYFIAGQSNAAGTSRLKTLDDKYKVEYPNVLFYNGGDGVLSEQNKWTHVRPGLGTQAVTENGETVEMFGPELGMARVLSNKNKKIAFIKYAYGGTGIFQHDGLNNTATNHDNWHGPWDGATSGRLYNGFFTTARKGLASLKEKGYNPIIKGVTWMQGETDGEIQFNQGKYNAADVYEHNLTELFSCFRSELTTISGTDQSKMPIVFGEVYEYSIAFCEARKIVEAQANVGKLPNNYLINTGDLIISTKVDGWHWPGNQELQLGVRFGEKYYELSNSLTYTPYSDGYQE